MMVVYAVAAEASIIRIFLAGFLPGFLLMALFSGYIVVWALRNPDKTPQPTRRRRCAEKIRKSGSLIPCALLIVFIVWVLVAGWATATECAAYGVLGSLAIAWWGGSLTWQNFCDRPDGRHAPVLHDHVHPRRRGLPDQDAWPSPASRARSPSGSTALQLEPLRADRRR